MNCGFAPFPSIQTDHIRTRSVGGTGVLVQFDLRFECRENTCCCRPKPYPQLLFNFPLAPGLGGVQSCARKASSLQPKALQV